MSVNENYPELIEELRASRDRNIRLSEENHKLSQMLSGIQENDRVYHPQSSVAEMMRAFGQEIRRTPAMIENPIERELTAKLVLEEALEFVAALGFVASLDTGEITLSGQRPTDLVEAADAIGDILVVTYGAANRLGIKAYPVFQEVHFSNMSKVGPDGKILRRLGDGKVLKPESYFPPNIQSELVRQGWIPPLADKDSLQPSQHAAPEPTSVDSEYEPRVLPSQRNRSEAQRQDPDEDDLQLQGSPA